MKNQLIVAERFYSIQGEGRTMGIPSVFLRLSACNLLCKSESWICDSIASWQPKGMKTPFENVLPDDYVQKLNQDAHLIITGGEPLLQQKHILKYLEWFEDKYKFLPIIEIETNGTIILNPVLSSKIRYINCSPKLSNSGESYKRRVNPDALKSLVKPNAIFKFVITKKTDFLEILKDYEEFINLKQIVLMPGGATRHELRQTRKIAVELCKEYCLRYSDRLQVVIWNQALGV